MTQNRRAAGQCVTCGATPAPARVRCRQCLRRHAAVARAYYRRSRERSICSQCGRPASGGVHCEGCRTVARSRQCRREDGRRAAGLCPRCGGRRESARVHCGACREFARMRKADHDAK